MNTFCPGLQGNCAFAPGHSGPCVIDPVDDWMPDAFVPSYNEICDECGFPYKPIGMACENCEEEI